MLQTFHDGRLISGPDLAGPYQGTALELAVRLETLGLDETSRICEGLEPSSQLSVSDEVVIVVISSEREPISGLPVIVTIPQVPMSAPGGTA